MTPILEVENLKKYFHTSRGVLHAVDNVSFRMEKGTTLGVVGESGCGKSTLGRTIIHLLDSTDGRKMCIRDSAGGFLWRINNFLIHLNIASTK